MSTLTEGHVETLIQGMNVSTCMLLLPYIKNQICLKELIRQFKKTTISQWCNENWIS